SLQQEAWIQLRKNKVAIGSLIMIIFICAVGLLAPVIAPFPFDEQYLDKVLRPPGWHHWLGTDSLGRDMLSRLIYGARISMAVGVITAIISFFIGTAFGA